MIETRAASTSVSCFGTRVSRGPSMSKLGEGILFDFRYSSNLVVLAAILEDNSRIREEDISIKTWA